MSKTVIYIEVRLSDEDLGSVRLRQRTQKLMYDIVDDIKAKAEARGLDPDRVGLGYGYRIPER